MTEFDRAMNDGWTSHGHWYGPGEPDPATESPMKARCGGPGLCSKCSREAAATHPTPGAVARVTEENL